MKYLILTITFTLFASSFIYGQLTNKPLGTKSVGNGYIEYLPPSYSGNSDEKLPVIIFFHGSGENGNGTTDLNKIYNTGLPQMIKNETWTYADQFVVLMPQHTKTGQYDVCPSANEVRDFIDFARRDYNIDPSRVYLTGLSCGGNGIWDYIGSYPTNEKVAAAVPISANGTKASRKAGCDKTIPTWAFHGKSDTTSPWQNDVTANDVFNACPSPHAEATLTLYPGVGHDAWTRTYDLSAGHDIYAWLLQHKSPSAETNQAPTDIELTSTEVKENEPVLTVIGYLSTVDPDGDTQFAYSLVEGGTENGTDIFSVYNGKLKTKAVFDYNIKSSYRVKIRSSDPWGLSIEKWFDIHIIEDLASGIESDINSSDLSPATYPNPVKNGVVYINKDHFQDSPLTKVRLTDLSGHEVKIVYQADYQIDVSHLTSGIYMYYLESENKRIHGKIIIR